MNVKTIALSVVYVILVAILLILINSAFSWFFNNAIFDMLNWFNDRPLWLKILLLIIGVTVILKFALTLFMMISTALGNIVLRRFPSNYFTQWISFILFLGCAYYSIKELWGLTDGYDFWIIAELLLLSFFIIGFNFSIIQPNFKRKELN